MFLIIKLHMWSSAVKEEMPYNEQEKGNEREQLEPASEEAEVHMAPLFWDLFS